MKAALMILALVLSASCTVIDSEGDVNFEQNHVADREISIAPPNCGL